MKVKRSLITVSLIGILIRLILAPFFIQSYDFAHFYYSALDIAKGVDPYEVYDFSYPPLMLYIFSFLSLIYFKAKFFLESINLPSFLEWPPLLIKSSIVSVTLVGFHIPPPLFNMLFKTPIIAADLFAALLLYKIAIVTFEDARLAYRALLLWYFNPLVIWISAIHGAFDSIAALFMILALYMILESKFILGGFSLGLGIFTKLYPAFTVPIIVILSMKAKKLRSFILGLSSSIIICIWPVLSLKTLSYAILGPRGTALFLGGLNFWSVKYASPQIEKWILSNSSSMFIILLFLFTFFLLVISAHAWRKIEIKNLMSINFYILSTIIVSYLFLPIIVQPQYALWVLPSFILSILNREKAFQLKIQLNIIKHILRINHRFLPEFYYNLFWFSALFFEVALQGPSTILPAVLKTDELINIFSLSLIHWVRNLAAVRAFIFFVTGLSCTLAYLVLSIEGG